MPATETLTVRLSTEADAGLVKLAATTRRPKTDLAAEAIEAYVVRESEIVAGIERGLDDMHAGRVIPHDEAMRRLRATVERARQNNA
jgi:predicted transcriptional regulator